MHQNADQTSTWTHYPSLPTVSLTKNLEGLVFEYLGPLSLIFFLRLKYLVILQFKSVGFNNSNLWDITTQTCADSNNSFYTTLARLQTTFPNYRYDYLKTIPTNAVTRSYLDKGRGREGTVQKDDGKQICNPKQAHCFRAAWIQ
jgi:hypothetical protein